MRTSLLLFALCATALAVPASAQLNKAQYQSVFESPMTATSSIDEGLIVEKSRQHAPVVGSEGLIMDSKTISYLCPDFYYPLSKYQQRATTGQMDVMTGYDGDILKRFKGNHIKTLNLVVDNELKSVSVFIKNSKFETVFEKQLNLDELEPWMLDWNGSGQPIPWGKYAAVPVDYEIGDEPFYVGYHLETSESQAYGMFGMLAQLNNAHKNCYVLNRYDDNGNQVMDGCVPFIWCDTEGEGGLAKYDVAMNGTIDHRCRGGEEYFVSGTLTNFGTQPVNNIKFSYTGPDGTRQERILESPDPLAYMTTITFSLPINANTDAGVFEKDMEVAEINGNKDARQEDNSTSYRLISIDEPANRVVLAEDFTGTWCGYCTRGQAGFDYLHELYPNNIITTEYHVADEFTIENHDYDFLEAVLVMGYPNAIVNHNFMCDPWSGLDGELPFGMGTLVEDIVNKMPVETSISASGYYTEDGKITARAEVSPSLNIPDGSIYELGFTVVEDGYKGIQQNNYSSENGWFAKEDMPEQMWKYYDLPKEFECEYNNVVRCGYGILGNPGSVKAAPLAKGEKASYEVSFPSENINDLSKASLVAYVMDAKTKEVLNAIHVPLDKSNGIAETISGNVNVATTAEGLAVTADGTFSVAVYTAQGLCVARTQGENGVSLILPGHGIYVVAIENNTGRHTSKVVF